MASLNTDWAYLVTPFASWCVAGSLKFAINTVRSRGLAFAQIGYGGLPSNHSAIVSSMAALIALKEGIGHPAFGVALTLSFIVMLDANSLRRQIGNLAAAVNGLRKAEPQAQLLRERVGHSKIEILAGIAVGCLVAWSIQAMFGN